MSTVSNTREYTRNLVVAALFTAFIAAMSQVSIPLPIGVPITLQTFAVALCGFTLGWNWALGSMLTYLLIGAIGVPVFSSFGAGVGVIAGMTGGYLIGFIPMILLCGFGKRIGHAVPAIALGLAGLTVCHLLGILQFTHLSGRTFAGAAMLTSVPFLPKDIISVAVAYFLAVQFRKLLNRIF